MRPAPDGPTPTPLRILGPPDRDRVAAVAAGAFAAQEFYAAILGLDARAQARYFRALFALLLCDPHARVYGLEEHGRLIAAAAVVFRDFPRWRHGARFLLRLLTALGPRRWWRYLRFVRAYEHAMRVGGTDADGEARAYWLFVDLTAKRTGAGSALVRAATADLAFRGRRLITGFVDASNAPLLAFYRRHGFAVSPTFAFLGRPAARVTRRIAQRPGEAPCSG